MKYKTITISDHRYNGFCGEESILENSLIIELTDNKQDSNIKFRRRFIGKSMISVTKEAKVISFNINIDKLINIIDDLTKTNKYIKNEKRGYSIPIFLSTFSVFCDGVEYEIPLDSDIGNEIMETIHFIEIKGISNKEISKVTNI